MRSAPRAKRARDTGKQAKSALVIPEAGRCNGTELRRATRRVSQLYDAVLAPGGLRSTQWSILTQIARTERPNMGELASSLVIDRSALAHNLKPLERDGLVEIVVDQDDKRTRLATLTAAGRIKLTRAMPLWESAQRCFEAVFGAKNAVKLRASLKLIASPEFVQDFQRAGIRVGRSGRRPDTLYSTSALRVK
jgi:DNA-binding MarR family transcriptional regulator